jgi:hypothetical protein
LITEVFGLIIVLIVKPKTLRWRKWWQTAREIRCQDQKDYFQVDSHLHMCANVNAYGVEYIYY